MITATKSQTLPQTVDVYLGFEIRQLAEDALVAIPRGWSHQDIAMLEAPAHDSSHVTGNVIPHTVHHPLLSQSVGVQVQPGRVMGSRELRSA